MGLPSIVLTSDSFNTWLDATNAIIAHVGNASAYVLVNTLTTGNVLVDGVISAKTLNINASANVAGGNINISANIVHTGANAYFSSDVFIADAKTLKVSGATNALGTLGVTGAVNALGTVGVAGALNALGNFGVTGTTQFTGAVNALGTLGVTGATNALGTLGVTGAVNALGTLGVTGTFSALGQMTVAANANFDSGTLFVDANNNRIGLGNTTPTHTLRVEGTTSLNGATNALSTLGVTGAMVLANTLSITGAVNALGTLGVTGATTLSNTLSISGAVNALSTLGITGAVNALSTVGINGILTVTSNAVFKTNLLVVDTVNNRIGIGNAAPTHPFRLEGNSSFNGVIRVDTTNGRLVLPVGSNLWAT